MMAARAPVVSVIGSATCTEDEAGLAEAVGGLLAARGATLVCGGRGGVMEAACRGAIEAGGTTIGILPGADYGDGNPFLSIAIPTGLGQARNVLVVLAGEAAIAIGGGYGTLSEIGLALKHGRPVIGLQSWIASNRGGRPAELIMASSAEEAVELAFQRRKRREN